MRAPARLLSAALAAAALTLTATLPTPAGAAPEPAQLVRFGPGGQASITEPFAPGGATPVIGSFDDRSGEDILWYTPGAGGDAFWSGNADGTWEVSPVSVSGTYTPYVGTFAEEDKGHDIVWYSATGTSQLWDFPEDGGPVVQTPLPGVGGPGKVLVGDFTSDGYTDLIRYQPGTAADSWWDFEIPTGAANHVVSSRALSVNGSYTPVVGQFARDNAQGDYGEDVLWYAPGTAADTLWDFNANASITARPVSINGTFKPLVGRWMASAHDQILWYAPGAAADSVWSFNADHTVATKAVSINGTYTPYSCDCVPSGAGDRDDIVFHGQGNATDVVWSMNGTAFAPTAYTYAGSTLTGSKLATWQPEFDGVVLAYG